MRVRIPNGDNVFAKRRKLRARVAACLASGASVEQLRPYLSHREMVEARKMAAAMPSMLATKRSGGARRPPAKSPATSKPKPTPRWKPKRKPVAASKRVSLSQADQDAAYVLSLVRACGRVFHA